MKNHGLRLRTKKCSFGQPKVEVLGHMVDKRGVHVDDSKMEKIKEGIAPTIRKELRSFLGLASYNRRFITDFAKITKLLSEKISKKVKYAWTKEMQESFEALKEKLIMTPVLAYSAYQKSFVAYTDGSNKSIRAVLT